MVKPTIVAVSVQSSAGETSGTSETPLSATAAAVAITSPPLLWAAEAPTTDQWL